ncbi:MAG: transketolase C-terminal domain-containing protein, partial [bacterium]|nr:transketolase C-terminal domain-containing protein [bacterium]
ISFLRTMPNMKIFAPCGKSDFSYLLNMALIDGGPVAIRYPRDCARDLSVLPVLEGYFCTETADIVLIGIGPLMEECLIAHERLLAVGIKCSVFYSPQVWPITDTCASQVQRASLIITVEDNITAGGFGNALLQRLHDEGYGGKLISLGHTHEVIAQGPRRYQLERAGLTAENIISEVLKYAQR